MKTLACFIAAALLAGCNATPRIETTRSVTSVKALPIFRVIEPNPNLVLNGLPPIPESLVGQVDRYTDFGGQAFIEWHPTRREMLIAQRPPNGKSVQLFRLSSPMAEPQQLTTFFDPVTSASYDPVDGKYIVFERDPEGNQTDQIYRMELSNRGTTLLTTPNVRHRIEGWLHRSSRLLVSSFPAERASRGTARPSTRQVLSVLDPSAPTVKHQVAQLPGVGWTVGGVSWDDRYVALNRSISADESQVWLIDRADGKLSQLLPPPRSKERGIYLVGGFKRDNSGLYVISDRTGDFREFFFYRFSNRRLTSITRHIPWNVSGGASSEDGKLLALRANVEGRQELKLFDAHSFKEMRAPKIPPGSVTTADFHRKFDELALTMNNAKGPSQIFSVNPTTGGLQQWTKTVSAEGVDTGDFSDQQIVHWKSFDGRMLSGVLTPPPQRFAGPRPLLIALHDGPQGQATVGFLGRYNYLVNELGIALLEPNVRGSSGFGKAFLALDDGKKREDPVRDIGALLEWVATQPQYDAKRVVLSGGGYGGYLVLEASTRYSERIAGAIDVAGFADIVSLLRNTEEERRQALRQEFGDERTPAVRAFLQQISPLTNSDRIRKPLFIVQGKNDPWVPYGETEQIVQSLRDHKIPVWYLRAENEGHGFANRENANFQFYSTITFLKQMMALK